MGKVASTSLAINKKIDKLPVYPDLSQTLTYKWDKFAVTADWHLPFIDVEFFKRFIKDCHTQKVKKLVIAGDFFDMNAFGFFFSHNRVPWKEEKECAKKVMSILQEQFDEIVFIVGNHEIRFLRALADKFQGNIYDIYELIGFTDYDNITLKNKVIVNDWMITHPKNARKNSLSLGNDLSNIYKGYNIIVTHAHRQSLGRDFSGSHWVMDLGLMSDPKMHEYIHYNVGAFANWNQGYSIITDNFPTLYWK